MVLKLFKNGSLTNALQALVNRTPKLMVRVIIHVRVEACIYCVPRIKQSTKSKNHNPLFLLFLIDSHVLFYHFIIYIGLGLVPVSSYTRPITMVMCPKLDMCYHLNGSNTIGHWTQTLPISIKKFQHL